jgi:hypothetical protein
VAVLLFGSSLWYVLATAQWAERPLFPKFHDEFMYLLQARMLAAGRLWMAAHPVAEFFGSFFVVVRPVYASAYFPGTAMLYVPGVWLGLAPWLTAAAIAAGVVTLLYLVVTDLIDGVAGLLAALLLLSLEQFRVTAVMTMSHTAMMLLLLATVMAYRRWQRTRAIGWTAAVGALAGWAAITRPLDAICVILPLGVAMLWDLRRSGARKMSLTVAAAILGALPFLVTQLAFDRAVTGRWLETPISLYGRQNFPGLTLGFGPRVTATTESPAALPQVRDYYRDFLRNDLVTHGKGGIWRTWLAGRWEPVLDVSLPNHLLFILLPVGLFGLRRAGGVGAALLAGAVLLPLAYAFWPPYLKHYGLVVAPAYVLLVVAGVAVIGQRWPRAGAIATLAVAALAIASLPEVRRQPDRFMSAPYLADINQKLADLQHTPAVVLFRYESGRTDLHEEPVYNLDAARIDDAPVIRAQDLGDAENPRIFAYYANLAAPRYVYRYSRTTGELTPLGWAKDLANSPPTPAPSAPPVTNDPR